MDIIDKINTKITKNENVRLNKNLLFSKKKINRNKWLYDQHENLKNEMIILLKSSKELKEFLIKIDKNKLNSNDINTINKCLYKLELLNTKLENGISNNTINIPKLLNIFININIIASIVFTIVFGFCGFHVAFTDDISSVKSLVPDYVTDKLGNTGIAILFILRSLINLFTIKLSFYIKKSLKFEYIKDKEKRKYKELRLVVNDYKKTLNTIVEKISKINSLS